MHGEVARDGAAQRAAGAGDLAEQGVAVGASMRRFDGGLVARLRY